MTAAVPELSKKELRDGVIILYCFVCKGLRKFKRVEKLTRRCYTGYAGSYRKLQSNYKCVECENDVWF